MSRDLAPSHDLFSARQGDAQQIAGAHGARRLGRQLVEIHLAPVAGGGGQGPTFEEARGPQPFVEAHIGHDGHTVAQGLGYTREADATIARECPQFGGCFGP